jgi:hypothetical protein
MGSDIETKAAIIQSRLSRIEWANDILVTEEFHDQLSIDFNLLFPNEPTELTQHRRMYGLGKSSIVVGPHTPIDSLLLRLPPLLTSECDYASINMDLFSMADSCADDFLVNVRVRVSTDNGAPALWWPHVEVLGEPGFPAPDVVSSVVFVRSLFHKYRKRYWEPWPS